MHKLVLQIIIRQWDKSQLSEQHKQPREDLPDQYPLSSALLLYLMGGLCSINMVMISLEIALIIS